MSYHCILIFKRLCYLCFIVNRDFTAQRSFIPLSQSLSSVTYRLNIIDDDIFEDTESLIISAEFDDGVFSPISVPITIFDNDSKLTLCTSLVISTFMLLDVLIGFSQSSYTITENSGTVNIVVVINGRIARPIEVLIETHSNMSATREYRSVCM